MNNDINEKIVHAAPVPPFVRFVASAVPMVFDNSLSYYEALCAISEELGLEKPCDVNAISRYEGVLTQNKSEEDAEQLAADVSKGASTISPVTSVISIFL